MLAEINLELHILNTEGVFLRKEHLQMFSIPRVGETVVLGEVQSYKISAVVYHLSYAPVANCRRVVIESIGHS